MFFYADVFRYLLNPSLGDLFRGSFWGERWGGGGGKITPV